MRTPRVTSWTLAATLTAGIMVPAPVVAADKETDLILAELRQLQAQVSQLQRAQVELGRMLRELTSRAGDEESSMRRTLVDTQTALDDIRENLSILSSRLDETNDRMGNLRGEMESLRQIQQPLIIPEIPTEGAEGGSASQSADAGSTPGETPATPIAVAAPGPVELYNQAYTDYTQLRYPLAISGFEEVIHRYPESDLADNAQYWIGECLLAQRQFQEALDAFDDVLAMYPDSNKLAEANYKKAIALQSLDRREEAIAQLQFVIEQFPRTQVERSAVERLKQLNRYQP